GAENHRLGLAEERVVAALGVEVVADDEEGAAVEGELAGQRLAAVVEGRVGRIDPAGAVGELRAAAGVHHAGRGGRGAAGAVDEAEAAVGAEEEADADVAAGLAAVLVVDRVDLAVLVGRAA